MFTRLVALFALLASVSAHTWTYESTSATCDGTDANPCGPAYWNKVSATCNGQNQSPIDISQATPNSDLGLPVFTAIDGGCGNWTQYNHDYSFKLSFTGQCSNLYLTYNNEEYVFQQMHLHSTSEHTFAGGYYSAEAHMVHLSASGKYIVLGVLLDVEGGDTILPTSNNTLLNTLWETAEDKLFGDEEVMPDGSYTLNPYDTLLPPRPSHFRYSGSFTTPPCTEGVEWFVYEEPVKISQDDLRIIRKQGASVTDNIVSQGGNSNRYPQPKLNGRTVYYVSGEPIQTDHYSDYGAVRGTSNAGVTIAVVAFAIIALTFLCICKNHCEAVFEKKLAAAAAAQNQKTTANV